MLEETKPGDPQDRRLLGVKHRSRSAGIFPRTQFMYCALYRDINLEQLSRKTLGTMKMTEFKDVVVL